MREEDKGEEVGTPHGKAHIRGGTAPHDEVGSLGKRGGPGGVFPCCSRRRAQADGVDTGNAGSDLVVGDEEEPWSDAIEALEDLEPSKLRALSLLAVGLCPLASCVLFGEAHRSVLVAMVVMHWGVMLIAPALYYLVYCCSGHGFTAYVFYTQLFKELQVDTESRSLRGSAMGIPVFIVFWCGYSLFRCKTLLWPLCIRNFLGPLEDYGFEAHSMPFRIFTALYFTFWNPFIEEFFWRVFLHREFSGAMCESNAREELALLPPQQQEVSGEVAVWRSLLSSLIHAIPGRDPAVRWGVSAMYASYHTWPVKVVFQEIWWFYVGFAFCFLVCLGRFFLVLREHPRFGLPAAYVLHVWVDAAFAALCLFKVHPYELGWGA